jgi:arsenate reductase
MKSPSFQRSERAEALGRIPFDLVVTVCGNARESCSAFPGRTKTIYAGFDDPLRLAEGAGGEEEALGHFRRVRDEIKEFVETLPGALDPDG